VKALGRAGRRTNLISVSHPTQEPAPSKLEGALGDAREAVSLIEELARLAEIDELASTSYIVEEIGVLLRRADLGVREAVRRPGIASGEGSRALEHLAEENMHRETVAPPAVIGREFARDANNRDDAGR